MREVVPGVQRGSGPPYRPLPPDWAAKFLDDWCQQVMRSRIEPMKKVAKTLRGIGSADRLVNAIPVVINNF
jgi:hypothetical protein